MRKYKAVFFDMDGTVLNTLEDLTIALNYAMEQTGHRHDYTMETVRCFFGSGIRVAIRRALALENNPEMQAEDLIRIDTEADPENAGSSARSDRKYREPDEIRRIRTVYQPYYEQHCNDHTVPYPGIMELLEELRQRGIRTAVISNKPDAAVQILADELFPGLFDFAAGEKPGTARKPAPDLVLETADAMQLKAEEILYVGDSEIDLQTAANAGMDCAAVTWGFRNREMLTKLQPAYLIDDTAGLPGLL
ncbi:MAG: HAD-IA family hydrolase [Eubacterium sp.]|nr:HAD-IA family hydrolase [Eubacterium sp.]